VAQVQLAAHGIEGQQLGGPAGGQRQQIAHHGRAMGGVEAGHWMDSWCPMLPGSRSVEEVPP
jgi:hypothetical protein